MKLGSRVMTTLYLIALLFIWWIMCHDVGDSWLVTLFLFSPRWVVAMPLLLLLPMSIWKSPRFSFAYFVHVIVILFPIMGLTLGVSGGVKNNALPTFRIMTCNLGGGDTNITHLISLAKYHQADALLLQECPMTISKPVLEELGWNHRQVANLAIGSPHELGELKVLSRQPESSFNAIAGVACEVNWLPASMRLANASGATRKKIQLVDVHFPTFRPAFEHAREFDDKAGDAFVSLRDLYNETVALTKQASQRDATKPEMLTLIAGDFNVPVDSDFYRRHWDSHQNALSIAGRGFNYTKQTRLHGIRIDHVVVDSHWRVLSAEVGPNLGGDHFPVIAELQCISW